MTSIEDRFVRTVADLDLPDGDLVEPVLRALAADEASRSSAVRGPASKWGRLSAPGPGLMAAAVVVVVVVGLVLAVSPAGRAVAGWLGVGATAVEVEVERSPDGGTGIGAGSGTEDGTDTEDESGPIDGDELGQDGPEQDLERSIEALGSAVAPDPSVLPIPSLGPPQRVFDHAVRGRSYVWDDTVAEGPVLLSVREVDGAELAVKSVAGEVGVELVTVESGVGPVAGLWIDGDHRLAVGSGALPVAAGKVLLWEVEGIELRLEGDLGLQAVLDLAGTVETGTELLSPG